MKTLFYQFNNFLKTNRLIFQDTEPKKESVETTPQPDLEKKEQPKDSKDASDEMVERTKNIFKGIKDSGLKKLLQLGAGAAAAELIRQKFEAKGILERLGIDPNKPEALNEEQIQKLLNEPKLGEVLKKAISGVLLEMIQKDLEAKSVLEELGIDPNKPEALNESLIQKLLGEPKFGDIIRKMMLLMVSEMIYEDITGKGLLDEVLK